MSVSPPAPPTALPPLSLPNDSQTASPVDSRSVMSGGTVVVLLSLLLGLQPITTDLYLPALPVLTEGFGAPMSQAQLTLTALLLAFGLSQLLWGPLSDRFGRRPVLLMGLVAFAVASAASTLASSMEVLIACRIAQGIAMGAGVVCARAIVRDLFNPLDGARAMSKGLTGLGIIACACAPLGGLLTDLFSWRVALMAPAVFGVAALAVVALQFKETLARPNLMALKPAALLGTWGVIVRNPTFLAFSALATASYGGLFTFLAASSFVYIKVLHLTKTQYGLVMFSISFVYILGTLFADACCCALGVRKTVAIAGALTLTGGTTMGVLALAGVHNAWALTLPFYLFMVGHGVHQPCGQSGAVGPFPLAAGAASALNGFVMMLAAFAMGAWLGTHIDGTVYPLAFGIWFWSVLISLTAWTLVQKYGERAHP